MADRKFKRGEKEKYSLYEKEELGKLCRKYKEDYDEKVQRHGNHATYNAKRKKHTTPLPQEGYIARAVREYYSDLKDLKHDNPVLVKAIKLGKRCYERQSQDAVEVSAPPAKSKFRQPGGGRKSVAPEVRGALYDWFIDIRGSLKARLPRSLLKAQAQFFYDEWLSQQPDEVKRQPKLIFSNKWIKGWMSEFNVSLRKPNKRFQIKQTDREERVFEYVKNVWTVRKFFLDNFSVDPPIINGDQMPLHRNESASQKTLSIKGCDTYVKENYTLSRERVTAFTQASSDPSIVVKPEFVFKGKGTRTHLSPPDGIKYHWAPKGSYRLEQMLATISNLPNRHNLFMMRNYCIYVLDDYSVHLMPEVKSALLKRGYVLIGIGGGVTGDIQINDTDIHSPLKKKYRELEQELMIAQLRSDPNKIPQPNRNDMMRMLVESFNSLNIDISARYKALWLTNKLDGSEDYLVSERIMRLVGERLKEFREELMKTPSPKNLKDLMKLITPPKGVRRKQGENTTNAALADEGDELYDCDGDEIPQPVSVDEEFGPPSDGEAPDDENEPTSSGQRDNASTVPTTEHDDDEVVHPSHRKALVELAPLCEDEDLKKDAKFVDELGALLQDSETSSKFLPHLTGIQRQYIAARRQIKKRIELEQNGAIAVDADPSDDIDLL